jgi:hypothetical protein
MPVNNNSTKPGILEEAVMVAFPDKVRTTAAAKSFGLRYIFCNIMPQIPAGECHLNGVRGSTAKRTPMT